LSVREEDEKFLAKFSIPRDLHRRFKSTCASLNTDMSATASELIEGFLENPQSVRLDEEESSGVKSGVNFLIDADLHRRFKVCCSDEGLSMSFVISKLLEDFLDREN
jgi:hypothetical protein